MKFSRSEPGFHYRALRMVSEGGRWELGMSPYSQGMRLRMGRIGRPPSVLDFCLGHDTSLFLPVLTAVLHRLAPLAETDTAAEIDAVFPWAGTRPDPAVHLCKLLQSVPADFASGQAGKSA
jgi:hypothetical protein